MRARTSWLRVIGLTALSTLVVSARLPVAAQSPVLIAEHFALELKQSDALARADNAIRAAGLTADPPTAISRGGRKRYVTVLIHCIEQGKTTLVDLEVAEIPNPAESADSLRSFLTAFMKTGKAPRSSGFAGEWITRSYGGYTGKMRLRQEGNRVTGSYEGTGAGTIDGTVSGRILRYRWTETNGNTGTGKATLSEDGSAFAGAYSYDENPDKGDRYWNGTRAGAEPPLAGNPGGPAGNSPSGSGAGSNSGTDPAPSGPTFSGEWETTSSGGYTYRMKLRQVGSRVTGTYENAGTKGGIEGTVTKGVLRFRWTQANGNKGAGRFSMLPNGTAFAGAYTYEDDPDKADKYWDGKRVGAPPANPSGGTGGPGTPPGTTAGDPPGGSGAVTRKGKELPPLGPALSPPGFESKRPIDAFPSISITPAPLPLPPVGHDREIQGQAKKYTEPIIISRLRLTHKPVNLTRGLLQVDIALSRKPIGECYVDLYVGGYVSVDREAMRFNNVYCTTTVHTTTIDDRYTASFPLPDVLPATVRAELVEYGTGRVIDKAEARITASLPDLYLVKVLLWGDEKKNKWESGAAIVTGTVPDDKTVWIDYRTKDRDPAYVSPPGDPDEVGRKFYGYGGKTNGGGISIDKVPGFERIAEPGLTGSAFFFKWSEKDVDRSRPGVKTDGAWCEISVPTEGVMDQRKVIGFNLPNRGYDPSRLVRRPVSP